MKKYALLFSISLVFFLIGNLPASLFASSIQSPYLLEGSVWQGHTNNPKFGKIDWSFSPLALFQAKLGWYMHIEQETHALVFDLSIDTSKQLQFSDITGTLSSATLKKFKLLPDNISNIASFEVKIDEFDIDWNANNLDARPDSLQGLVQVKKLNVLGELLGDYQLRIDSENEQLNGVVTDKDAQIKANLNITLSPDNKLNIQGDIKANNQKMQTLLNGAGINNKVKFNYQL
ncbi:hypothetical protein [uncultured Gammaproteobacteria bacterium]|jgi:hypothetical protein|nr:hypothetical protein [uncultured Gammaproteobacteria bacterium]CAC9568649.1 hypothetical protein [uncultured Gammaproteobacteria bacterium]CAC9581049.1 hypothetical protein [uncultured Gammaproteobacteria bacterium]CAC9628695.1 hypothetical protein [uncultured Gammaproteobacteria bacterium]CAC9969970.1 hypothetical protein [uncultured Gammaproteobacteria bacterium]